MMHTTHCPLIYLGVNIDHIATLRNVRGTPYPDPLEAALLAEAAGADLITLHLREDRRHIREEDVKTIRKRIVTHMNLELAVTSEMIDFACAVAPQDVCLVPERRAELTTEGGLDVVKYFKTIQHAIKQLHESGIRVSLFVDADPLQIQAAHEVGSGVIEIHTGRYADSVGEEKKIALIAIQKSVTLATSLGLVVNAGHGLHYANVAAIAAILEISELNIGHAIVAQALFVGWEKAVRDMKAAMVTARLAAYNGNNQK